ncbi:MAG: hypothetical protein RSC09_04290 [Clostridia bacterium]
MKTMYEKINNFGFKVIYVIFLIISLIILMSMIKNNIILTIASIILLVTSVFILNKRKIKSNTKYTCYWIFAIAFALRLLAILVLKVKPISDFMVIFEAAENLAKGNNTLNTSTYFLTWAYQTGMVIYQAVILKIFKTINALNILDCVYTSFICVYIYKISNKTFEKINGNKIGSLLYTIYIYAITYTAVLTNQHIFSLLALIGLYIYLSSNNKYIKIITSVILISIANILRTESILIILSMICYEILQVKEKKDIISFFKKGIIIFGIYFIITNSASFLIKTSGINKNGLENKDTLWKFVCGSDYTTNGGYSEKALTLKTDKEKIDFIKKNYDRPIVQNVVFMKNKISNLWTGDDYSWAFNKVSYKYIKFKNMHITVEDLINIFEKFDRLIYISILILNVVSVISSFKRKNNNKIILYLIVIANFLVYLMIEVQPRYSYFPKIIMFIIANDGYYILKDYVAKKLKSKNYLLNKQFK